MEAGVPLGIVSACSSLYLPFRLLDRPPDASDSDRSLEMREAGLDVERLVEELSWLALR